LTGAALLPTHGVGADLRHRSPELDARQEGAAGAGDVHGAECFAGVEEAVGGAGVVIKPMIFPVSLLPKAVVLVACGTLMGVNTPAWSRKPWDPVASGRSSTITSVITA
jgi:hypothetical protein